METGRAAVDAVTGLAAGRLDLAALPTLAIDPVAPLVGAFRVAHPGVDIALADPGDAAEVVDLVASGECELGITAESVVDPAVTSHSLAGQDLLAVLPPGSKASRTMAIPTLATFPLVTAPAGTTTRSQLEEAFAEAGVTPGSPWSRRNARPSSRWCSRERVRRSFRGRWPSRRRASARWSSGYARTSVVRSTSSIAADRSHRLPRRS